MARLFDARWEGFVPLPDPAADLPLVAELDPLSSRKLAVTQLADLLAAYQPRLSAAGVRDAASPGRPQAFDPEAFKAAVSALHRDILTEFAGDQRQLSGYQLGVALSDMCWLPSAASGPDAFIATFRREQVAALTTWLIGSGTALPESSAAIVGRSLEYWQDWTDANSGWLKSGGDSWAQRAGTVLSTLREQGQAWHWVLSLGAEFSGQPGIGAWRLAVSSVLGSARILAYRILRLYWAAAVLLAVMSGGLLYLIAAGLSGSARVLSLAGAGAAVLGLALAGLRAGVSRAADGIWLQAWGRAKLDARAWHITSLPDVPRQGEQLARRGTAGILACAVAAGLGAGLAEAGATIAEAAAVAASVLVAIGIAGAFLLQTIGSGPARRQAKSARPAKARPKVLLRLIHGKQPLTRAPMTPHGPTLTRRPPSSPDSPSRSRSGSAKHQTPRCTAQGSLRYRVRISS